MSKRSIVSAALAAASLAHAGPVFQTIAVSGGPAPGLSGVTFDYLSDPRIGSGGVLAFWADLSGSGVIPEAAGSIWSTRSGALSLIYREGAASGQGATSTWAAFPSPCMSADGRLAFTGSLADTTLPNNPINLGLFSEDAALALQKIAREGEPTPTTGNWVTLPQVQRSDAGISTFFVNASIWTATTAQPPSIVASNGSAAPGGLTFDSLGPPAQNGAGTVLFRGTLRDGAAGSQPIAWGLYTVGQSGVSTIVRSQTPAPGTGAGFADFAGTFTIDAQERATFWARLSGLGTGLAADEGIFAGTAGNVALKVREGDQAAGCPVGTLYLGLNVHPAAAANGAVAFASGLSGTPIGSGVWIVSPGGATTLLARSGDQVPRLPAGVVYSRFQDPYISDAGRVVVLAQLSGAGVTSASNHALLVTDPGGRAYPILRTGDTYGSPPRVIDEIVFDSGAPQSGRTQLLDDAPAVDLALKLVLRDPSQPAARAYSHAIITASLGCLSDMDGDGQLTVNDFLRFLLAFNSGNIRACDFSGNGVLDIADFVGFINAANTACP